MAEAFATEDRLTKEKPTYLLAFYIAWSLPREMEDLNVFVWGRQSLHVGEHATGDQRTALSVWFLVSYRT